MARRVICVLLTLSLEFAAGLLAAETSSYSIQEGETIFGIAKKVNIPLQVLCTYNGIDDPSHVKAGTLLKLPLDYTVKKGDTLYSIARGFSVSLSDLLSLNGLKESSPLKSGGHLFVPTPAPAVVTTPGPPAEQTAGVKPGNDTHVKVGAVLPHPGKHEPFEGKISGLVFHGTKDDPVVAADAGEVKWVGPYWGWGKTVIIKGDQGYVFIYAGNEELLVNVGDRVKPGTEIARLGVSPQDGNARLYFSIQSANGQTVDPEKYFSGS